MLVRSVCLPLLIGWIAIPVHPLTACDARTSRPAVRLPVVSATYVGAKSSHSYRQPRESASNTSGVMHAASYSRAPKAAVERPKAPAAVQEFEVAAGEAAVLFRRGLGDEAGRVLLHVNGLVVPCEVLAWEEIGVAFRLLDLVLERPAARTLEFWFPDARASLTYEVKLLAGREAVGDRAPADVRGAGGQPGMFAAGIGELGIPVPATPLPIISENN